MLRTDFTHLHMPVTIYGDLNKNYDTPTYRAHQEGFDTRSATGIGGGLPPLVSIFGWAGCSIVMTTRLPRLVLWEPSVVGPLATYCS